MEKKVLMLTEKNISFLLRSVYDSLAEDGYTVVTAEPDITSISKLEEKPYIIILHAGDFTEDNQELLVYLRDLCAEENCRISLIGYPDDIETVKRTLSFSLICSEFTRPLNVKQIVERMNEDLEKIAENVAKKHILVVDDSGMMLRTIRGWLADKYRVSLANSAASAFTFMNTNRPDLILLDYEMPVCDGPQFLHMLRTEISTSDIPVIFLTSVGDKESIKKVLALKPDGYLLKSTSSEEVIRSIDDFFLRQQAKKHL